MAHATSSDPRPPSTSTVRHFVTSGLVVEQPHLGACFTTDPPRQQECEDEGDVSTHPCRWPAKSLAASRWAQTLRFDGAPFCKRASGNYSLLAELVQGREQSANTLRPIGSFGQDARAVASVRFVELEIDCPGLDQAEHTPVLTKHGGPAATYERIQADLRQLGIGIHMRLYIPLAGLCRQTATVADVYDCLITPHGTAHDRASTLRALRCTPRHGSAPRRRSPTGVDSRV